MTARTVISVLYYEDAAPQQRKEALDECSLKFQQHLDSGATIGLVDVCGIVHGCCLGLQETYIKTLNRYIQILYGLDILRFDIQWRKYDESLRSMFIWPTMATGTRGITI